MPAKKIVIIGAGVAGLSAGCYAQMNGYDSAIYELHNIPGGLCTSWSRGDYTFNGGISWLTGSAPDGMFYPMWSELGVTQGCRFLYGEEYCRFVGRNGAQIVLYADPDRLREEFLRVSPQDGEAIGEFCGLVRELKGFTPPVGKAAETMGLRDMLSMMADLARQRKKYGAFFRYGKIGMRQFAEKFKGEDLRYMLSNVWGGRIPVSLFAAVIAWYSSRTAGYPQGGSLKVAQAMEQRYLGLGGQVHYGRRVKSIAVKDGRAEGVALSDGAEIPADAVISAADGHSTIFDMLGGAYLPKGVKSWYEEAETFPPYIQVSLGVNRDMSGEPRLVYRMLAEPLSIAGKESPYILVENYAFDGTLAPKGKTPLTVRFFSDYGYWAELARDRMKYRREKEALAAAVIARLEDVYPGISGQVEEVNVATPATYVRYTETWRGATMSWLPTPANFGKSLPRTLPGLKNFYMAGQWLVPGGGLPYALKTGREAVQVICKRDGKRFTTTTP